METRASARRCRPLAVQPGSDAERKGKRHEEDADRKPSDERKNSRRNRSQAFCYRSPSCWKYADCGDPEHQLSGRNGQDECLVALESAAEHHRCKDNTHNRREERRTLPNRTRDSQPSSGRLQNGSKCRDKPQADCHIANDGHWRVPRKTPRKISSTSSSS